MREKGLQEEGNREDLKTEGSEKEDEEPHFHHARRERRNSRYAGKNYSSCIQEGFSLRTSQSVLSLTETSSTHASSVVRNRCLTTEGPTPDKKLPACPSPRSQLRRNTLPSVTVVPPLLHLPPLFNQSDLHLRVPTQLSPSKNRTVTFLPRPPSSAPPSCSPRAPARAALLPPLPLNSSVTSLAAPSAYSDRSRRSLRRRSVQLEKQI